MEQEELGAQEPPFLYRDSNICLQAEEHPFGESSPEERGPWRRRTIISLRADSFHTSGQDFFGRSGEQVNPASAGQSNNSSIYQQHSWAGLSPSGNVDALKYVDVVPQGRGFTVSSQPSRGEEHYSGLRGESEERSLKMNVEPVGLSLASSFLPVSQPSLIHISFVFQLPRFFS